MNLRQTVQSLLFLVLIIAFTGCQSNPIEPGVSHEGELLQQVQSHNCLGFYALAMDTRDLTVDVQPLRTADLHLNITGILNATMGISVAGVPSESDPVNGYIVLDITLEHPFGAKPQLSGFDVKGILITPGSLAIGTFTLADTDETRLVNADGYTRWWNPTEFTSAGLFGYIQGVLANAGAPQLTATVNPYKLFADVLEATDSLSWVSGTPLDDDEGRAVFTAGSSNTRRYQIQFPMDPGPQIVYGYAIDASWNAPSPNPPVEIPDDFPINANQPEPYRVVLQPTANSLYYDTESGMLGGVLRFQVNVHDWQGMITGDIQAEVSTVRIYSPDLFNTIEANFLDQTLEKARYTYDLTGLAVPSAPGESVVATRVQSATGPPYDQGLGHPAPTNDVSAWQAIVLDVIDPGCEADSNNSLAEAVEIGLVENVTGELCDAVDTEDWYSFEIPAGYELSGEVRWYSDADTHAMALYNADGDYLQGAYNMSDYLMIDFDSTWLPPGTFYVQVNATQVGNPGPAGMLYLLETELELVDVRPENPVDVTPGRWNCSASWLGTDHDDENKLVMTGAPGTWGYTLSGSLQYQSRTHGGFTNIPGYYHPYLYIWNWPVGGTVDLVDYSSIYVPVVHESVLSISDPIRAMVLNSTDMYVIVDEGANSYVRVYDYATDPTNPVFLGSAEVEDNVMAVDLLDPEGPDTTLVVMAGGKTVLYDVEYPELISGTGSITEVGGTNTALCASGIFLIKANVDTNADGILTAYKWDSSTGLEFWGSFPLPSWGASVDAKGAIVYVGGAGSGINIVNIVLQGGFFLVTTVPTTSDSRYIHATDSWLLNVQEGPGVVLYDLTNPVSPVEEDVSTCLNTPYDVEIKDDYAFYVEGVPGYGTVTAIYAGDPPGEFVHAEFPLEDVAFEITGYDDLIAVGSSAAQKIWIYDYTVNPLVLNEIYSDTTAGNITAMEMTNEALYVSLDSGVMQVYDTSLAPAIFQKPDCPLHNGTPAGDFAIDIYKNYAYVAQYGPPQVDIYDASDLYNWSYVISISPSMAAHVMRAEVMNDYLYLLTDNYLGIFDQSDPETVVLLSKPDLFNPGNMQQMDVDGQYAYVTDYNQYIEVVSVYPPDAGFVTGYTIPTPDAHTTEIKVHNGMLYVCKLEYGVRVYDLY